MKYQRYYSFLTNDVKPSGDASIVGSQYVCTKGFSTTNQFGKSGKVKVGDAFTVLREPIPKKKMYKLYRSTKFGDEYVYVRKSTLKQYFERVKVDSKEV